MGADPVHPLDLFSQWLASARSACAQDVTAMTLVTATPDGHPSARVVLLKGVDRDGFTFYTNYGSRKARELDANPHVGLVFYWAEIGRQVRVEGTARRTSVEESERYFRTRPRGSQIGAWASRQSEPLASREELEAHVHELEARFAERDVPLPPFWGGYRVAPARLEFWENRPNRLHERLLYTPAKDGSWSVVRLSP